MIELTKLQRKILKLINQSDKKSKNINQSIISKKLNLHWYDCVLNIQILIKNNLIRIDSDNFLHPLPFGKAYFELEHKHEFDDILKSLIIPIIVSLFTSIIATVTTSLVTLWLKGL